MIMLITLELHGADHEVVELTCQACAPRRVRVNVAAIDNAESIKAAVIGMLNHAQLEHGGRDFFREGAGQDTRRPVLSLPPGPIASNSSGGITDCDDHG